MEEKKTIEMTAAEAAAFAEFKAQKEKEQAKENAKKEREQYKIMVDAQIEGTIPVLLALSNDLKDTKSQIIEEFKTIISLKTDVLKATKDDQRSHTFTNTDGNKRITLGVYVVDGYRDTVEEGIGIVKEYIESLAGDDAKTKSLVSMVLRLLARDAKGTLKASRVLQLRKMADDSGNERFIEGVQIIEEAYQPAISKQFIKAEVKNDVGAWVAVPLGMTEA